MKTMILYFGVWEPILYVHSYMQSLHHVAKGYPWLLGGEKASISACLIHICQNYCVPNNLYLKEAKA